MMVALLLFVIGLSLSAFFSGSETGLYRVPRVRLVLDGLSGRPTARGLVWLLNNPALFVATTLVGNNLANYLVSLAIVMGVHALGTGGGTAAELLGPILMTPFVFVFGELLPKYLFFHAPYRLLRIGGPMFLLFTVLFAPASGVLGLLGRALSVLTGETPFRVRLGITRRELQQVFREGHEAGLLSANQRALARNVWQVGSRPALAFGVLPDRLASVDAASDRPTALTEARRQGNPIVLVRQPARRVGPQIVGYFYYCDLLVSAADAPVPVREVLRASAEATHLSVLIRLYETDTDVAVLESSDGRARSVVTRRQLIEPLLAPS